MNNDFAKLIQKAEQDMERMEGAYRAKCSEVARLREILRAYESLAFASELPDTVTPEECGRLGGPKCRSCAIDKALAEVRAVKEKV